MSLVVPCRLSAASLLLLCLQIPRCAPVCAAMPGLNKQEDAAPQSETCYRACPVEGPDYVGWRCFCLVWFQLFFALLLIESQFAGFVSSTWPPLAAPFPGIAGVTEAAAPISVAVSSVLGLVAAEAFLGLVAAEP